MIPRRPLPVLSESLVYVNLWAQAYDQRDIDCNKQEVFSMQAGENR
jgi:hypothetical protein